MTIGLAVIPYAAASGAEIDLTSNTAVTEGAGGRSGRKSIRHEPLRNFHLTIGPDTAHEVMNIFLTARRRWPVALRDWSAYSYTNEVLDYTIVGGTAYAPLRRLVQPATGGRFLYQRLLVPDIGEEPTVVSVNGTPLSAGAWSWTDFGIVTIPGLSSGQVSATGQYVVPVCFMQDMLTVKVYARTDLGSGSNTPPLVGITDVQLREIFEDELISLMSQGDDSL